MAGIHGLFVVLELSVLAAVLHLDRVVLFQGMLHRPVFLAPLLGLVSGHLEHSLWIAVVCEFVSLLVPPTGSDIPPDESAWAAVASVVVAVVPPRSVAELLAIIGVSAFVLPAARNIEVLTRAGNLRLADYAEAEAQAGNHVPYKRLVFASVLGQMMMRAMAYVVLALLLIVVVWFARNTERSVQQILVMPAALMVVLAPVVLARRSNDGQRMAGVEVVIYAGLGLAVGAGAMFLS